MPIAHAEGASWDLLTVIDGSDSNDSFYPVLSLSQASPSVDLKPDDHPFATLTATGVKVLSVERSSLEPVLTIPSDFSFSVVLTPVRIVLSCAKFEKGSTWFGTGAGAVVAVAAMAVSAARAASRRKGKLLAGHIRYQWVDRILVRQGKGWLNPSVLRIVVRRPPRAGGTPLILHLELPKQLDARAIGRDLAARVATFRLQFDTELDDAERESFVNFAQGIASRGGGSADADGWVTYAMPTSWPVTVMAPAPRADERTGVPTSASREVEDPMDPGDGDQPRPAPSEDAARAPAAAPTAHGLSASPSLPQRSANPADGSAPASIAGPAPVQDVVDCPACRHRYPTQRIRCPRCGWSNPARPS